MMKPSIMKTILTVISVFALVFLDRASGIGITIDDSFVESLVG